MSIPEDFFDSLSDEFEKAEKESGGGEAWNPDAGEVLKGIFMSVEFVNGDYGWSSVGVIKNINSQDTEKVWFSSGVLKERMMMLKPAPGTPIAIRFDGQEKSQSTGRMYKKHTVAMPDREEGDVILGREYWAEQETTAKARDAAKQQERAAVQAERPDEAPF